MPLPSTIFCTEFQVAGDYVVLKSAFIDTVEEAQAYYRQYLAASVKPVMCYGHEVRIRFERENTHPYSEDLTPENAHEPQVQRKLGPGRFEVRAFSLERARLLDDILPAIAQHTGVIFERSPQERKRRLHGRRLPDNQYLRVILRPEGESDFDWICVTAFPVPHRKWMEDQRSPKTKFPPEKKTPR